MTVSTVNLINHYKRDTTQLFLLDTGCYQDLVWSQSQRVFVPVLELPVHHQAVQYLVDRKIPQSEWTDVWYTDNFLQYAQNLVDLHLLNLRIQNRETGELLQVDQNKPDPRIVFVCRKKNREVIGLSARYIGFDQQILQSARYVTIETQPTPDRWCVWGLDRCDTNQLVYVLEGAFDCFFLDNSISLNGLTWRDAELREMLPNFVFVFDNEPTKSWVTDHYKKAITLGHQIFIWPLDCVYKDLNEMVLAGVTRQEIKTMILTNTFNGQQALEKFLAWTQTQ